LIEDLGVARGADVMRSNKGEPEEIVGDSGANAGARLWMPPVLDIAFYELPCGRTQNVLASQVWRGEHEGHHVLQLITEPISAARLIKGRAAPDPATESLIKQPAVD
jgi:hypothetical protein